MSAMSFDNIPAEVIKRILGYIPDLRDRCRLERVSKTFQSCLFDHSGAAWTTGESKLALGKLLRHSPEFVAALGRVTSLSVRRGFAGPNTLQSPYIDALSALYRNTNVFQLTEVRISELISTELWNFLLSSFHNSLTKLYIKSSIPFLEGQIETVCKLLGRCTNLQQLSIDHGSTVDYQNLYLALRGKSLEKLCLNDGVQMSDVQLAQIVNSLAEPRRFTQLVVRRDNQDPNVFLTFSLNNFCQGLDAAAGEKMRKMCLDGVRGSFLESLPTIPALFPALRECELTVYATEMEATQVIQSLSEFLNAGQDREKPTHLRLVIFTQTNEPLLRNIWATLQLLAFNPSVRIKRMHEETRKVTYEQASLTLTFKTLQEERLEEQNEEEEEEQYQQEQDEAEQQQQQQQQEEEEEQDEDEEEVEDEDEEQHEDDEEMEHDSDEDEDEDEEDDDEEEAWHNNFGNDGNHEEEEEGDDGGDQAEDYPNQHPFNAQFPPF